MSSDHPRITLLGNNSGRNLGDAAILSAILEGLSNEVPEAEFYVPTICPRFVDDNYGKKYRVKGINIMPWTGSLRLLGIPTLRCLAKSDIALICDGIIFGRKLFSPHNFLITLIFLLPWARLFGCKVVCFSCGIGPFPSALSRVFARWVINLSDLVIMRDQDSAELAREIGVTKEIQVTGDAAFLNLVSEEKRARELAAGLGLDLDKPIIGVNVTPYIDSWLKKSERLKNRSDFLETIAQGLNQCKTAIAETDPASDIQYVIFSCSPMDEAFSEKLAGQIDGIVVDNSSFLSHDIQAIMRHCGLLVGMRFHSLVLSSGVGVPIVGLIYAPKVRGYMRLLDCSNYGLELKDFTAEELASCLCQAWVTRKDLKHKQQEVVCSLAEGARKAASQVKERYFSKERKVENKAVANA